MLPTIAKPNEPRISVLADAVYRAVAQLDFGTVVSYNDLALILFEDPRGARGRAAVIRAGKRLLREDCKLLVNVRGQGYQIAKPNEHVQQSKRHVTFGLRRYRKALAIVAHTEIKGLAAHERQQVEEQANRVRLALALSKKLQQAKALPSRAESRLPSGRQLADMLKRTKEQE